MSAPREFVEKYYADYVAERDGVEGRWARQHLRDVVGKHVLNVGCGPLLYDHAADFLEIPAELVGIDINESNVEFLSTSKNSTLLQSKMWLEAQGTKTECFVHDARVKRNDFIDRFDAIYASSVLDMFSHKDTTHILSLLFQYLKLGGRIVLVSWDDDRLTPEKLLERNRYNWYWRNGLGLNEMENVLKETGFKILKSGTHNVADPVEYEWGIIYSAVAQK